MNSGQTCKATGQGRTMHSLSAARPSLKTKQGIWSRAGRHALDCAVQQRSRGCSRQGHVGWVRHSRFWLVPPTRVSHRSNSSSARCLQSASLHTRRCTHSVAGLRTETLPCPCGLDNI